MTSIDRRYSVAEGTAIKAPVRVATTANITLGGLQVIDGVTIVEHDRVLVKDQTNQVLNGIYEASTGNWLRTKDFDGARDIVSGTRVLVASGTVNVLREFMVTTADPITIGTTSLSFTSRTPGSSDDEINFLYPDQFNALAGTGNKSIDTAAWTALAVAYRSGYIAKGRPGATYLIDGSTINFSGFNEVYLDLAGSICRQQSGESVLTAPSGQKTFSFTNCGLVKVRNGTLYGKAAIDIAHSIYPTEFITGSGTGTSSWNGTAGLYFESCNIVDIDGVRCIQHAGGGIKGVECLYVNVRNCYVQGIGSAYIAPVDSCSDFGISFGISAEANATSNRFTYVYTNNRVLDHAFGFQANLSKSFIMHGNTVGPIPGQHGIYGQNLGGMNIVGNIFIECAQIAIKMNYVNYPGLYFAAPWVSGGTYTVASGDRVTYNATLYACIANVSGSATNPAADTAHWAVSDDMWHRGGVISGNTAYRCLTAIGLLNGLVDGLETYMYNLTVSDNIAYEPTGDGFILERCKDINCHGNKSLSAGGYGFRMADTSGHIYNNISKTSFNSGLLISCPADTWLWNNQIIQAGDIPLSIVNVTSATTLPSHATTPRAFLDNNRIHFASGDASGVLGYIGTNYEAYVTNTRTNSAKTFTCDGTLIRRWGNEFVSFTAGTQSTPYITSNTSTTRTLNGSTADVSALSNVLATLIADLTNRGHIE